MHRNYSIMVIRYCLQRWVPMWRSGQLRSLIVTVRALSSNCFRPYIGSQVDVVIFVMLKAFKHLRLVVYQINVDIIVAHLHMLNQDFS